MVIPAVDVLDMKVVTLVGGKPGTEKITLHNPREVALEWESKGAPDDPPGGPERSDGAGR